MPSYRTHSIHGEYILDYIDKYTYIDSEYLKLFCIGPDSLIGTDYKLFDEIHKSNTKNYFLTLLKYIKDNKLQEKPLVMTFLYGQLEHFILDLTMHPLIYYVSEDIKKENILSPHALLEHLIDDYVISKYSTNSMNYYEKLPILDDKLIYLINKIYKDVYNANDAFNKYNNGINIMILYDFYLRNNNIIIEPLIESLINLGDIKYHDDYSKVIKYLNLDRNIWYNPETGMTSRDSFDDLWNKSLILLYDIIFDVNNYLYKDKEFKNKLILNDISYNTGIPCKDDQTFKYIKRYK